MSWPWSALGLEGPAELPAIRRAYAQRLKTTHPEEDPEGFQRLHDAYQEASRLARKKKRQAADQEASRDPEVSQDPEPSQEERVPDPSQAEAGPETAPAQERPDQGETATTPEPDGGDWDYDRLFAEGKEEAREARRRYLEELRAKNRARYAAQEAEQRRRAGDEAEAWEAVMAATQALELLRSTGAGLPEWQRFLKGPVFWSAKANLDFVFALEDFLEQDRGLPKEVRKAIFAAYGFEKGPGRPEYKRLYSLLDVDRKERRRLRRERSQWRRQWRSWPKRRQFATVFGVVFLCLMTVIGFWDLIAGAGTAMGTLFRSPPPWRETALEWLEEDFGCRFVYAEDEDDAHIFAPAIYPDRHFFAYPDGERDLEAGSRGYQTNYPDRMVMAEMENVAREEGLELIFDSAGDGFQDRPGETPGPTCSRCRCWGARKPSPGWMRSSRG